MAKTGMLGTAGKPELRIVMGNTSCDMDSVVGALTLGYFYTRKSTEGHLFVPVINCKKDDFFCNLEITMHLQDSKIPHDDLLFWDTFREIYKTEQVTEVALVDHNRAIAFALSPASAASIASCACPAAHRESGRLARS